MEPAGEISSMAPLLWANLSAILGGSRIGKDGYEEVIVQGVGRACREETGSERAYPGTHPRLGVLDFPPWPNVTHIWARGFQFLVL